MTRNPGHRVFALKTVDPIAYTLLGNDNDGRGDGDGDGALDDGDDDGTDDADDADHADGDDCDGGRDVGHDGWGHC